MRDPNRIDFFLAELGKIWKEECPDWRFGQLVVNVFEANTRAAILFSEEDKMLEIFEDYFNIIKKKQDERLRELAQYTCSAEEIYGEEYVKKIRKRTRKRGFGR